jgi:Spy/CpxP family protein refolding chaperone
MTRFLGLALLAAAAAAPLALEAQTPRAPQAQEQAARPGTPRVSLERLAQLRAELDLSDDQVGRLQAIAERLRHQNAPLVEQLRASGAWQGKRGGPGTREGETGRLTPEQRQQRRQQFESMTPEQREALRQQMQERRGGAGAASARGQHRLPEELRPAVEQIRTNARMAMDEARAVLTAEQQIRLREIVQQRRTAVVEGRGQVRGFRGGR